MSRSKPTMRGGGVSVGQVLMHLLPAVLFFALFAGVGILHVTSRVLVVDMGYRMSRAEAEARTLTRENDRLKLELATLKNPARLERLAREKLGMAMPSGPVVIAVPAERPVPARAARLGRQEARLQVADRGEAR